MQNQYPIIFKAHPFTEAALARNVIEDSEEKYRVLFYNSPLPMWIYELENYRILDVNKTAITHYGYSHEEFIKMTMMDIGKDAPIFLNAHKDIHNHEGIVCFGVCIHQKKNKELILVEVSGQAFTFQDNDCIMVICNDVTEREHALQKLKDNEAKLLTAEKIAKLGYWKLNNDGQSLYWSDEVYNIWGVSKDSFQVSYQSFFETIHPEDRETFAKEQAASFEGEKEHDIEHRIILPDSSVKWVHEKGKLRKDDPGKRIFFEGSVQDITEFKKSEIKLKEAIAQQSLFVSIVNSSDDAIVSKTLDGIITSWNRGAETIFGYTGKEAVGKNISIIIPANLINEESGIVARIKLGKYVEHYETERLKKDGSLINISLSVSPILDTNGNIVGASKIARDITERKKAKKELKTAHERLFFHLENSPMAFIEWDNKIRPKTWSQRAEKIFGWTEKEATSKQLNWFSKVYEEDLPLAKKTANELIAGKVEKNHVQHRNYTRDGRVIWCEWFNSVLRDDDGKVISILSLIQDITERKKAEENLRRNEMRLNEAQAIAQIGNWEIDFTQNTHTWSDELYRIFGIKKNEVEPSTELFLSFMHPDDTGFAQRKVQEAFDSLKESSFNFRFIRKDGIIRHGYSEWKFEFDKNGKPLRLYGIVQDLTELRKAEEGNSFKANLLNTIGQAVMATDLDGIINFWNKAAGEIYGWTVEEAIGRNVLALVPTQQTKEQAKNIIYELSKGHSWSGEVMVQRKDHQNFPIFVTEAPIYDQNHKISGIIGVSFDITERKKGEKDLKELSQQLRDLSSHLQNIREEERKRIGREIHDDLGQQLTAIKMDVAWVDKKIPEETTVLKSKLKNIIHLLDKSNQSIRRILSELRPGILDDLGLLEAIEWLGKEFTANTGIPFTFTTAETEIKSSEPVATCIFRVHQEAFTNITRYARANKVSTSLSIIDGSIVVSIEDDGIGFDAAHVQHKKSFGILGMKERVLSLRGKFELISSPGKGTKIIISLPYDT